MTPWSLEKHLKVHEEIDNTFSDNFSSLAFIDVCGFTRLASILRTEDLETVISIYFTKMLNIVEKYNGDVIKFCGDAVMISWPHHINTNDTTKSNNNNNDNNDNNDDNDDNNNSKSNFIKMLKCVQEIQHDCGGYVVDSSLVELPDTLNNITLNVRIGVACGTIHGISVGCKDANRFEYLYTGVAVEDVGVVCSLAKPGQICVRRSAWYYFSLPDEYLPSTVSSSVAIKEAHVADNGDRCDNSDSVFVLEKMVNDNINFNSITSTLNTITKTNTTDTNIAGKGKSQNQHIIRQQSLKPSLTTYIHFSSRICVVECCQH